jgi:hypothetical protein
MDWPSFIASVIGSIAWPATALAVVLLLRRELVALLPFLRKLKAGPVEAEFEREVKELESEAAATSPPPEPKALEGKAQRLFQLAEISPRAAVLEAWQGVEFAARRAVLKHAGSPIPDVSSPLRVLRELTQLQLLSSEDIALFQDLRGLRNQATHSPDFNPSYEAVASYLQLAGALQARLEKHASIEG